MRHFADSGLGDPADIQEEGRDSIQNGPSRCQQNKACKDLEKSAPVTFGGNGDLCHYNLLKILNLFRCWLEQLKACCGNFLDPPAGTQILFRVEQLHMLLMQGNVVFLYLFSFSCHRHHPGMYASGTGQPQAQAKGRQKNQAQLLGGSQREAPPPLPDKREK
ncbi:hypothetical protein [Desulfobulbus oralis]|uniref:hypothetical protein n=1 Tax=Desulfobulbus oralis TaxID=1986146 RepID=UPI0015E46A61|nr:hypothetical protein [Desulfobulbus oralis]